MKKLLASLLAIVMALALTACAPMSDSGSPAPSPDAAQSATGTPEPGPDTAQSALNRAYALEKLNEVNDMVLNRQVVPGDYLRYLDEELAEKVEEYNSALANAKGAAVRYAKDWAESFRDFFGNLSPEDDGYDAAYASYGRYLEEGDNYYRFIEEFSTALLWYPNHYAFMIFQPVVGYPAGRELGGSGGLWANGYYLEDWQRTSIDELTAIADELLDQFDNARAGWRQEP